MKIFLALVMVMSFLFGVDINTANVGELTPLNGIGQSKAKSIVEFRKGHCFTKVSELSLVKGIGTKTIEKNKDKLSVSKCK